MWVRVIKNSKPMQSVSIKESFESVYQQADHFVERLLLFYGLLALLFATIHQTWLLAIVSDAFVLLIYGLFRYGFTSKQLARFSLAFLLFCYPPLFVTQLHGYPLVHLFFPSTLFILIVYRNFNFILVGTLPIFLHYLYFIYQHLSGLDIREQFLNVAHIETPYLLLFCLFFPFFGAFMMFFIVQMVRRTLINNVGFIEKLNEQADFLEKNKKLASEIAQNKENIVFEVDKTDELGRALKEMHERLTEANEERNRRNWTAEGLAKFANILREEVLSIDDLYDSLVENLVKYIGANQAGLFILEAEESSREVVLELKSCYAFDRKRFLERKVYAGEGLVGQAFLEKETIYLTEVPENYIKITSGLGEFLPRNLVFVPLKTNGQVVGVVELASFEVFPMYKVQLIEQLGESVASAINTARINKRTQELLERSQQSEEQLRSQEEEMRQNLEELVATQEEMQRKQQELEKNNIKMKSNEAVLKKALENAQDIEKESKKVKQELAELKALLAQTKQHD